MKALLWRMYCSEKQRSTQQDRDLKILSKDTGFFVCRRVLRQTTTGSPAPLISVQQLKTDMSIIIQLHILGAVLDIRFDIAITDIEKGLRQDLVVQPYSSLAETIGIHKGGDPGGVVKVGTDTKAMRR